MKNYYAARVKAKIEESQVPANLKDKKNNKRAIVLWLDKSGSMYGKPINAVIQGAIKVGEQFQNSSTFDKLLNIEFNYHCKSYKFKSLEQYQSRCEAMEAYGGTDFAEVFDTIMVKYKDKYYSKFKDLTIVFMTDGMTDSESALKSLNNLPD